VAEIVEPDRSCAQRARASDAAARVDGAALLDYLADRPIDSVRSLTGRRAASGGGGRGAGRARDRGLAREVLEGAPRRGVRRGSGPAASSCRAPAGVRSREKMVWDWPRPGPRIEDLG